jgi:hypothetical protein
LLPEDNTHEILLISKMLAVEFADAIDRSQPGRAAGAVQLAFDYADSVSRRSVPDWTASGAVADTLALGIRSVHEQLDEKTAEELLLKIAALEKSAPNPNISLVSDAKRIKRWLESIEANKRPVQPETVPHMTGMDPSSRAYSAPEFQKSIEALAPNGEISPDVFYAECRIAAEQAEIYLLEPRGPIPTVDGSRHPIGALVMTMLNPTVQAAADLAKLRQESLRLLALTVKLSGPSPPDDIGMLGEEAISPVSELPFEYRRTNGSFDLVRPRKRAGA